MQFKQENSNMPDKTVSQQANGSYPGNNVKKGFGDDASRMQYKLPNVVMQDGHYASNTPVPNVNLGMGIGSANESVQNRTVKGAPRGGRILG